MEELGSIGIVELITLSCVCLVPIILAAGVVIALLVVVGRGRKPKAETRKPSPPAATQVVEPQPAAETKPKAVAEPDLTACGSCGADNPADNAFCEYCGASLSKE